MLELESCIKLADRLPNRVKLPNRAAYDKIKCYQPIKSFQRLEQKTIKNQVLKYFANLKKLYIGIEKQELDTFHRVSN